MQSDADIFFGPAIVGIGGRNALVGPVVAESHFV